SGYYYIDSEEGIWNSGKNSEPNLAFRPRHKEGYFPVPPTDKLQDLRSEIMLKLIEAGVRVEVQHHEVGTAGQAEIDMRFDSLTTNSYRRLVPGYEAPINLVYSKRNRSACVRIPMYSTNPKTKRVEFRSPDPAANPYLAFSACLMAGLDGIKNKVVPPEPVDKDIYELEGEEKAKIKSVPGSLAESLDALEKDHAFLLEGGVFTKDVIDTWIDYK